MYAKITKVSFIHLIVILFLSGCANGWHPLGGLGLNLHTPAFQAVYDEARQNLENQARQGKITWVNAAKEIRRVDYELARNKGQFDTSWKFDSYDEEYHSFCIALAEKLDLKQISVDQYIYYRSQKENQIRERQGNISSSQQIINQQQQIINLQRQNSNKSVTCTTYGITTTCN